jgi:hypothetical protein
MTEPEDLKTSIYPSSKYILQEGCDLVSLWIL